MERNWKVCVTYFKLSGKYYSEGDYRTRLPRNSDLHAYREELREMFRNRKRPGLVDGEQEFLAVMDVRGHPNNFPQLIVPEGTIGLPQDVRREVSWFAGEMEAKLKENDYKSHWSKSPLERLMIGAQRELDEVWEAVELIQQLSSGRGRNVIPKDVADRVVKECADLANMVMMVADNVRSGRV